MYNNLIKIKEFNDSIQISSYRLIDSTLSFNPGSNYSSDPDNILRISRSRSFSLLRDYIKSNHFDYFVTMTLKDDIRYDILSAVKLFQDSINLYYKYSSRKLAQLSLSPAGAESLESVKIMRDFLPTLAIQTPQKAKLSRSGYRCDLLGSFTRSASNSVYGKKSSDVCTSYPSLSNLDLNCKIKRSSKGKEFKYLYVFELTKGGGVHLHGFFSGFYDLYINQYGYRSSLFFDRLGFQNYIEADKVNEFYLMKYITKSSIPGVKRRFFRSRNLEKPVITKFLDKFDNFLCLNWSYRNEYCNMITIASD